VIKSANGFSKQTYKLCLCTCTASTLRVAALSSTKPAPKFACLISVKCAVSNFVRNICLVFFVSYNSCLNIHTFILRLGYCKNSMIFTVNFSPTNFAGFSNLRFLLAFQVCSLKSCHNLMDKLKTNFFDKVLINSIYINS
jgi:hypothetical protein